MAASSCSSSSTLVLQSLSFKTLIPSKPTALSIPSTALPKPFSSISASFLPLSRREVLSSRFARSVAVSSEFDQEEDVSGEENEPDFSPDLKLFVGNLPFTVDSAQLAGLFEQAGNVQMVEVIYDKFTGKSRGYGFVTMSTVEEVEAAAQQFNGYEVQGRPMRVNYGPPPPREESSFRGSRGGGGGGGGGSFDSGNRVYVGNLAWGVDDLALETLFSEQGKVMEAKVVYDRESGRSRGFGFVTYSSAAEVDSAISSLNGTDLNGRPIRVTVAESKPRRQF
ncbi:hypothetical protein Scep_015512 [Stephania cephalantha]|uniref:RRM domain-containing protein n=1 Tax=Stephania cephalantha TaxID=152367 RepID=A0AAP0J342_9MAGN